MNEYLAHDAREADLGGLLYFDIRVFGVSSSTYLYVHVHVLVLVRVAALSAVRLILHSTFHRETVPWYRRPRNTTARTPLEKCAPILV